MSAHFLLMYRFRSTTPTSERSFTQEQIAAKMQLKRVNMSRDFYAHIENGTYTIRTSELIARRQILKCSYKDFFTAWNKSKG
ncbi:MAG: putative Xre family DNA-binding protein [Neobacillus sp.]|jgi:transcriptional regulator with XRE-family HTH domain|nr:putative Xre family DNA-binding protein [Neobacillus sp.]